MVRNVKSIEKRGDNGVKGQMTTNDKRQTTNDKWQTTNDKRQMTNDDKRRQTNNQEPNFFKNKPNESRKGANFFPAHNNQIILTIGHRTWSHVEDVSLKMSRKVSGTNYWINFLMSRVFEINWELGPKKFWCFIWTRSCRRCSDAGLSIYSKSLKPFIFVMNKRILIE